MAREPTRRRPGNESNSRFSFQASFSSTNEQLDCRRHLGAHNNSREEISPQPPASSWTGCFRAFETRMRFACKRSWWRRRLPSLSGPAASDAVSDWRQWESITNCSTAITPNCLPPGQLCASAAAGHQSHCRRADIVASPRRDDYDDRQPRRFYLFLSLTLLQFPIARSRKDTHY